MARNIQNLFKITSSVLKVINTQQISVNASRTLYSASLLGLDGYTKKRENIEQQFLNMGDKFREKMRNYLAEGSKNMVFTEDLKNMLHLVNKNPDDMELLMKMMVKFNSQNKELRFGSFVFGPVIMRTYYFLDQVDEALAAFHNKELEGFFDQIISYQILLDMLYNHERYTDVKRVFDYIIANHALYQTTMYPRHLITLVLAACYKENTPESFEYATDLWQKMKEKSQVPMRRTSTFFAGLALNQNKPDIAMEVICNLQRSNYVTVLNLKVAGLADLNRLDDVVPILRASLSYDNPTMQKHSYTKEAIAKIEQAIERIDTDENDTLKRMIVQLKQNGHITETPLADLISSEIVGQRTGNFSFTGNQGASQQGYRNNYQQGNRNDYQQGNRNDHQQGSRNDYQRGNQRNNFQQRDRQTGGTYKSFNNYNQRPGLSDLV